MIPLIHEHRLAIAELCRRYHVRQLAVFGSAARAADFDPATSDADFLVEFEPHTDLPPLRAYFGLREEMAHLLGRPVDLVESGSIRNPYLLKQINSEREAVYEA